MEEGICDDSFGETCKSLEMDYWFMDQCSGLTKTEVRSSLRGLDGLYGFSLFLPPSDWGHFLSLKTGNGSNRRVG